MPIRDFFTALLGTQGGEVSGSRRVPLAIAAPIAAVMDSAARADLGYEPIVAFGDGHARPGPIEPARPGVLT